MCFNIWNYADVLYRAKPDKQLQRQIDRLIIWLNVNLRPFKKWKIYEKQKKNICIFFRKE